MTVIGMGKLGGNELNFSSDIDIIYFYESDKGETSGIRDSSGDLKGVVSLHAFFNKLGEMISKALSLVTEDGFVFRVDVGLRPEGKSGDMAVSLRSAEIYYESWGQSWERTAMLKARPVAGSLELGEQLLKTLQPFVYRKYLDYNLIEDMKNMKQKIDASLTRSMEGETNLKLGRGGIREIEFFIQALQLVYAGKNPLLRERNSLKALDTLLAALSDDGDRSRLAGLLSRGVAGTAVIPGKHGGPSRAETTVFVVVPDHPGELARLLADAGEIGVNIEDLRIDHDPGREYGLVELAVATESVEHLLASLGERGWTAHR